MIGLGGGLRGLRPLVEWGGGGLTRENVQGFSPVTVNCTTQISTGTTVTSSVYDEFVIHHFFIRLKVDRVTAFGYDVLTPY